MFKSILLAIDINDPDGAVRCTKAAVQMVTSQSASLHILNVVPDDGMAIVSASLKADHNETAVEASRAALRAWAQSNVPPELAPQLHVARGKIYDQILKTARKLNVDAIVVGAHNPELKDYLLGSNAARVARHAKQSVFVIR
jgi:universal stress protein F